MRLNLRKPKIKPTKVVHGYTAPYAPDVHNGAMYRDGEALDARPWVWHVIDNTDFAKMVSDRAKSEPSISEAFIEANRDLGDLFDESIRSPIWEWPRVTVRKSGEVVGSPRNIVDEGTLANSYAMRVIR